MMGYDQKVEAVKRRLIELGARVSMRRRQLAHREKTYARVRGRGDLYTLVRPAITKHFPEAYMTSATGGEGAFDLTFSLDPR